eukprot:3883551-Rhodomonas_salina.1
MCCCPTIENPHWSSDDVVSSEDHWGVVQELTRVRDHRPDQYLWSPLALEPQRVSRTRTPSDPDARTLMQTLASLMQMLASESNADAS